VQLRHRGGAYMENLFSIARASLYLCARFLCAPIVAFSLAVRPCGGIFTFCHSAELTLCARQFRITQTAAKIASLDRSPMN